MNNPILTVRRTAVVVSTTYAIALRLAGFQLEGGIKQAIAYLPTILTMGLVVFDKWGWKAPAIRRFHNRPRLEGLWRGTLTPDDRSMIPDGGNRGPIESYLVVDQTFWSISITQFTAESTSHSRGAAFTPIAESSLQTLSFTYVNEPRRSQMPRSQRSTGTSNLTIHKNSHVRLTGSYFSDRFTAGEVDLELVDRKARAFADFKGAKAFAEQRQKELDRTPG